MTDPTPAVDPAALERLSEMTGGDPEFVRELIDTYLDDAPGQLEALREAVARGVVDDAIRPAHSLKSNSASMGADRLAELCRALEADARAGAVADGDGRVARIGAEFQRVRSELLEAKARL